MLSDSRVTILLAYSTGRQHQHSSRPKTIWKIGCQASLISRTMFPGVNYRLWPLRFLTYTIKLPSTPKAHGVCLAQLVSSHALQLLGCMSALLYINPPLGISICVPQHCQPSTSLCINAVTWCPRQSWGSWNSRKECGSDVSTSRLRKDSYHPEPECWGITWTCSPRFILHTRKPSLVVGRQPS